MSVNIFVPIISLHLPRKALYKFDGKSNCSTRIVNNSYYPAIANLLE